MHVLSLNLAAVPAHLPGMKLPTGIYKIPVTHPVRVHTLGLEGDHVCDTRHHGGADQAVYIYGQPDYDFWSRQLGTPLAPATFGENLTLSDLASPDFNIGDRLHIGTELVLEITAPRIPCGTLARRMSDRTFPDLFRQAERPGLYCRVLRPGLIRTGDSVRIERFTGPRVSILDLFRSFYRDDTDAPTLRHHLSAPIASRAANEIREQLHKLDATASSRAQK